MRIFEIQWTNAGEKSWVSAETNIHALLTYISATGVDITDLNDNDLIVELQKEQWGQHWISDENGLPEKTFEEWMKENNDADIICETMYDYDSDNPRSIKAK